MLPGLVLLWILWTRRILNCEALCDQIGSCTTEDDKYSLGNMSHVPRHRQLKPPSSKSHDEQSFLHLNGISNNGEDRDQMERNSLTFSMGDTPTVDKPAAETRHVEGRLNRNENEPDVNHLTSKEDARPLSNFSITAETILELSRNLMDRHGHGDDDDDDDDDEEGEHHHHHNDTFFDDEAEACNMWEHSWDEHCYFLTKKSIPGYRSDTECKKVNAEFVEIKSDEENEMISAYVRERDKASGQKLYLQILYVYINDANRFNKYRNNKFNADEEKFKKYVCDIVGCPCTALRSTTGTWHSRICDTRHYTVCRRPHHHPDEHHAESTPSTVSDVKESSTGTRGTSAPSLLLVLTLSVVLPLLSAVP